MCWEWVREREKKRSGLWYFSRHCFARWFVHTITYIHTERERRTQIQTQIQIPRISSIELEVNERKSASYWILHRIWNIEKISIIILMLCFFFFSSILFFLIHFVLHNLINGTTPNYVLAIEFNYEYRLVDAEKLNAICEQCRIRLEKSNNKKNLTR